MTELWVDADGPVDGATMAANGITGAIRYLLAGSSGKLITRAEYQDLIAHGRQVRFVVEHLTTDADAGYNAGRLIASHVPAALAALGAPADSWVYAANDKPGWSQADVDYVRGYRDVLGVGSTGAYGFGPFLLACHQQGVAGSLWQAGVAPSRTGTSAIVNFWQRQGGPVAASDGPTSPTTITLAGRVCDINNRLLEEDNMALSQADIDSVAARVWTINLAKGQQVAQSQVWLVNADTNASSEVVAALDPKVADVLTAVQAAQSGGMTEAQVQEIKQSLAGVFGAGWNVSIAPATPAPTTPAAPTATASS